MGTEGKSRKEKVFDPLPAHQPPSTFAGRSWQGRNVVCTVSAKAPKAERRVGSELRSHSLMNDKIFTLLLISIFILNFSIN